VATRLRHMQAGAENLGVMETSYSTAIIGVLGPVVGSLFLIRARFNAQRTRPGSPGGARPDARRLPSVGLGWRRRIGPATGRRSACATAPASSMGAGLGDLGDARGNGVQIDVSAGRQQRRLIEDCHALEPAFEERAAGLFLAVGQP